MEKGFPISLCILVSAVILVSGCNLVPGRPDAVFNLYRDRMLANKIKEARELLVDESRSLSDTLEASYSLKQPPEDLALLNALDPVTAPTVAEATDTEATLQVRTLKGGFRTVKVTRKDPKSPWQVDLTADLKSLQSFLEARRALEMLREQAGEYAFTWKAFNDRLDRMPPEPPPAKPVHPPQQAVHPSKPAAKPVAKPRSKPPIKKKLQKKNTNQKKGE